MHIFLFSSFFKETLLKIVIVLYARQIFCSVEEKISTFYKFWKKCGFLKTTNLFILFTPEIIIFNILYFQSQYFSISIFEFYSTAMQFVTKLFSVQRLLLLRKIFFHLH